MEVSTGFEYENRLKKFYTYADEMLELFKGQLSYEELKELSHKEAISLREARIRRLEIERDELERERERETAKQERENARRSILAK